MSVRPAGPGRVVRYCGIGRCPAVYSSLDPVMTGWKSIMDGNSTVGNVPGGADPATGTLYLPDIGHTVSLPSTSGFELQQPSGASDVVVAATSQALYSVDLSTGQLTTLSGGHSGTAAAPGM